MGNQTISNDRELADNKFYRIMVILVLISSVLAVFAAILLPFYVDVHKLDFSSIISKISTFLSTIALSFFNKEDHWKPTEQTFLNKLKQLELDFPNQKRETWVQIEATIGNTLKNEDPVHPAVITLLMPPNLDYQFGECFSKRIALALNEAIRPKLFQSNTDIEDVKSIPSVISINYQTFRDQSITQIRNVIESYFNSHGKALVINDIDKIKKKDHLMVFHGICDNYHAVDVRATVLFPVEVPEITYQNFEWTRSKAGAIANDVLKTSWKNVIEDDSLGALVARVADTVILLNEGDVCKM